LDIRRVAIATGGITTLAGAVDPPGMGPVATAQLADPRALILASTFALVAGGASGTLPAIDTSHVYAVIGRDPPSVAAGQLARFRGASVGTIAGVAYDETASTIYLTETSANRIYVVTVVDPAHPESWTIAALANTAGTSGFADGAAASAKFRSPTG